MPRRPRFWIHRTRRFWFGVMLLLALLCSTLFFGYYKVELGYQLGPKPAVPGPGLGSYRALSSADHLTVSLQDAGLVFARDKRYFGWHSKPLSPGSRWHYAAHQQYGFEALPSFKREGDQFRLVLPGTLLLAFTCLAWPFWLYRTERREKNFYEKAEP